MPKFEEITRFCSSLVEVMPDPETGWDYLDDDILYNHTSENEAVQLAHSSVKLFLTPAHLDTRWALYFNPTTIHAAVAKTCLCYTIQLGSLVYNRWSFPSLFPFDEYSAKNWMFHAAAVADVDNTVHRLTLELFLHRKSAYRGWLEISGQMHDGMLVPAPLYVACRWGLKRLSRSLLDRGADPNADIGSNYPSPAYAACERGEKEIIQMLMLRDADFSRSEPHRKFEGTPLGAACLKGHHDVVSMLLNHLHDSNIALPVWKNLYEICFKNACFGRHPSLIQLLRADISRVNSWTWNDPPFNPLTAACAVDSVLGFRIILDHLSDANIDESTWIKLLQEAFEFIHFPYGIEWAQIFEILMIKLQQVNANRHVLEQLYIDAFDECAKSYDTKKLEALLALLRKHDVGGRMWERISSEGVKKWANRSTCYDLLGIGAMHERIS